jgi:hypothetical protein
MQATLFLVFAAFTWHAFAASMGWLAPARSLGESLQIAYAMEGPWFAWNALAMIALLSAGLLNKKYLPAALVFVMIQYVRTCHLMSLGSGPIFDGWFWQKEGNSRVWVEALAGWPMELIYNTLPLPFAIVVFMEERAGRRPSILVSGVACSLIAAIGFWLVPVIGPKPFGNGLLAYPRNCFPSMHTGWVVLILLHSLFLPRWVQVIAFVYAVATPIACVGLGYHYWLDVAAGGAMVVAVDILVIYGGELWSSSLNAMRLRFSSWSL